MRISRTEMFIDIIKAISKRSTCSTKRVGAILVKDNRIISTGYNGSPQGTEHCEDNGCLIENEACIRTVHAESNVIAFAAKYGIATEGSALYTTMAPCFTCAKLIINAGISHVYYIEPYRSRQGLKALKHAGVEVELIQ